ncbi:MAG: hypothetical protein AAB681_02220 [Patescibacteria group bacterium]
MSLFNNILAQVSNKLRDKEQYKENIVKILFSETGLSIKTDEIKTKEGVLYINTSPTLKTAILLKKSKILTKLTLYKITTIQ